MICQRLSLKAIKLARSCVTLDLAIPLGPILFHQPFAELCKLVWIELDDLLFQLFDSGHGVSAEQSIRRPIFRLLNDDFGLFLAALFSGEENRPFSRFTAN
jgi:hypothetical protein